MTSPGAYVAMMYRRYCHLDHVGDDRWIPKLRVVRG
jgi:hypothetical protein